MRVPGIVAYGGYVPRWRLRREVPCQEMGWLAPPLAAFRKGERSFCGPDEDALTMAVAAARDCLTGRERGRVDGLHLCSTTLPFEDRLNSGILKEALQLRDRLRAADFTGSLRAGTTGLIAAIEAVKGGACREVLVTGTDRRIAKAGTPEELLAGDGAASLLIGDDGVIAELLGSVSLTRDFIDHHRARGCTYDYGWEERWVREVGYGVISEALDALFAKLSIGAGDVAAVAFPCAHPAAHKRLAARMGLPDDKVAAPLYEELGDTGAAHPLVLLVRLLEEARPGDLLVVAGFGQGADALCFRATEAIRRTPNVRGIAGSLRDRRVTSRYTRFLKFRELIDADAGIKADAPTKTALSVLWRKREMILGLVGGRCERCGVPQFPGGRICVNPSCGAVDAQTPYPFQDRLATVKTFTADMLGASANPPNLYGLIQFDGGGRMMAAFTDCSLNEVRAGSRMRMAFRKRYEDRERGFHGYFWKAIPVREEEG